MGARRDDDDNLTGPVRRPRGPPTRSKTTVAVMTAEMTDSVCIGGIAAEVGDATAPAHVRMASTVREVGRVAGGGGEGALSSRGRHPAGTPSAIAGVATAPEPANTGQGHREGGDAVTAPAMYSYHDSKLLSMSTVSSLSTRSQLLSRSVLRGLAPSQWS